MLHIISIHEKTNNNRNKLFIYYLYITYYISHIHPMKKQIMTEINHLFTYLHINKQTILYTTHYILHEK